MYAVRIVPPYFSTRLSNSKRCLVRAFLLKRITLVLRSVLVPVLFGFGVGYMKAAVLTVIVQV